MVVQPSLAHPTGIPNVPRRTRPTPEPYDVPMPNATEGTTPVTTQDDGVVRRLPPLLVNQIAAGEVVDRPASVVKELIDNAIDAGAVRIEVELEAGGIELVRVTDDGCGMSPADLRMCLEPHTTSKVREAGDLDRIATMGFRGEAMASIASVGRMSVRTRRAQDAGASEIEAAGETIGPVRPSAGPVGTSVSLRNLFFNTPARRKFLRTPSTEQGHCVDVARSLAMSHPGIGMRLIVDGRTVFDLEPDRGVRTRAVELLGRELEPELIEVSHDRTPDVFDGDGSARAPAIWGLVGRPAIAKATARSLHVFLNGRPIKDKTVIHAVREAYRGLMEPGRYPTAVLLIDLDPTLVDVNVHPAKAEVRWRDQSLVHSLVLRSVREALRGEDLTPRVEQGPVSTSGAFALRQQTASDGPGLLPERQQTDASRLVDFLRDRPTAPEPTPVSSADSGETVGDANHARTPESPTEPSADQPSMPLDAPRVLQIHDSYVVAEDEAGLVIVDQHALHERVMFEALLARVTKGDGGGALQSQSFLTPLVIEAKPSAVDRLGSLSELFAKLGIEAEALGPERIGLQAFPTFLLERKVEPGAFFTELIERTDESGMTPGSEETLHEVLDMMACKAAVKAGDRMSEPELRHLLSLRETVERSSSCPHGRPTSVRLTIRDLERLFHRS